MKKIIFILLLFWCTFQFKAQQNFINVPSSEATNSKTIFFQQQVNFNELIQSNTTLDFGLGKGFEIGANVLGLNFSEKHKSFLHNDTTDKDPFNPLALINCLKQFQISNSVSISTGGQIGFNLIDDQKTYPSYLGYTNLLLKDMLLERSKIVCGLFYNSLHYGGQGTRPGAWMALELPFAAKWHIMAESIFGSNALCFTSIGLIYYPKPYLPLTIGFQIPNTKSNSYALVFEFTFVPE